MQFYSTNRKTSPVSLREAVVRGLAADRGLFMPEVIRRFPPAFYQNMKEMTLREISFVVAEAFFGEDVEAGKLKEIVDETLNFDIPLVQVADNRYSLELFHGPTLAFKDVGARFMARLLAYFNKQEGERQVNVLVATSGDTGSAVANGFLDVPGVKVFVLYPQGKVSEIQEKQFTTLGRNITALEVSGTFDDCQALVKNAFMDKEPERETLSYLCQFHQRGPFSAPVVLLFLRLCAVVRVSREARRSRVQCAQRKFRQYYCRFDG